MPLYPYKIKHVYYRRSAAAESRMKAASEAAGAIKIDRFYRFSQLLATADFAPGRTMTYTPFDYIDLAYNDLTTLFDYMYF